LYKGSTQNLEQRLGYHNQGKVTFTSKYLPWELVLFEPFDTRVEATKREKWYKSGTGRDWIKSQIEQL
jgi:putative endonuclease